MEKVPCFIEWPKCSNNPDFSLKHWSSSLWNVVVSVYMGQAALLKRWEMCVLFCCRSLVYSHRIDCDVVFTVTFMHSFIVLWEEKGFCVFCSNLSVQMLKSGLSSYAMKSRDQRLNDSQNINPHVDRHQTSLWPAWVYTVLRFSSSHKTIVIGLRCVCSTPGCLIIPGETTHKLSCLSVHCLAHSTAILQDGNFVWIEWCEQYKNARFSRKQ